MLSRVGAEEVPGELLPIIVEQSGLGREEHECHAAARRDADVVLGADAVTHEEHLVARFHLNGGRDRRHFDVAGVRRLRQCDRDGCGESRSARRE